MTEGLETTGNGGIELTGLFPLKKNKTQRKLSKNTLIP